MSKFKILDTVTGLYSTGGCKPDWTKEGKSWNSIGQVKCHLKLHQRHPGDKLQIPETWVVQEFEMILKPLSLTRARDLLK